MHKMAKDLDFLKQASQATQDGLAKIYDVLERLAALEADKRTMEHNQARTEGDIKQLFALHNQSSRDIGAVTASIAEVRANVGNNTKASDRWVTVLYSLISAIATAIVVAKIIHP